MNIRTVAAAATTIAAALVLAGCGTDISTAAPATPPAASTSAAAPSSQHNDADVAFVQGMIPHHTQAVQMAQLAPERAGNEQVKQLATRIEQAQGPEIAQMRGFLAAWAVPESGGSMPGMNHDAMGHSGMSGMMSDQQMQQLTQARGAAFDRMFLQMMTAHHQGAVQMAQTELGSGSSPEAKALAQQIIDAQQSEIDEMTRLLAS